MSSPLKLSGPLKVGSLSANPSNPQDGFIYYNTTDGVFRMYEAGAWTEAATLAELGSTATGSGASLIGIEDSGAKFASGTVEGALAEAIDAGTGAQSTINTHLDGGASKHDATEVDYERADGSKKNIQATSDDVELALTDLDDAIGTLAASPTNYTPTSASIVADHLAAIDTALASAGGVDFADDVFRISDNTTSSKKIAFEASGITAATTRTITMPDENINLGDLVKTTGDTMTGNLTMSAKIVPSGGAIDIGESGALFQNVFTQNVDGGGTDLTLESDSKVFTTVSGTSKFEVGASDIQARVPVDMNDNTISMGTTGAKITNLLDPTAAQDAATKAYVDSLAAGLDPKESVRVATTVADGNIPGYVTGTITVPNANATYFPTATSPMEVDGVALVAGDRVLIKDQTDAKQNGIYEVTNAGTQGSVDAVLTRAADHDGSPANEVSGGNYTFVEQGTANIGTGWVLQGDGILTLDTDSIVFVKFNSVDISGKADNDLSNLTTTSINQSLIPDGSGKLLGTPPNRWDNLFTERIQLHEGATSTKLTIDSSGGNVDFTAGVNAPGLSDNIRILTAGQGTTDDSGDITFQTGDATDTLNNSGNISLITGSTTGGTRGSVTIDADLLEIKAGIDVYDGANLIGLISADATGSQFLFEADRAGDAFNITTKAQTTDAQAAGSINLTAGNSSGASAGSDGGSIVLTAGDATGGGADGSITLKSGGVDIQTISGVLLGELDNDGSNGFKINAFQDSQALALTTQSVTGATNSGGITLTTGTVDTGTRGSVTVEADLLEVKAGIDLYDGETLSLVGFIEAASATKELLIDADNTNSLKLSTLSDGTVDSGDIVLTTTDTTGTRGQVIANADAFVRTQDGTNGVDEIYVDAMTLTASQTNAVISDLTFAHGSYEGFEMVYKMKEATTNNVRIGTLRVVTNGTNVALNDMSTETADLGVTFDAVVNGADINIRYTSDTNNVTMRGDVKLIRA